MLKKKMQALAKENLLSAQNKFEIISDPSASQVLGGDGTPSCIPLVNCGTFNGSCERLETCGAYSLSRTE